MQDDSTVDDCVKCNMPLIRRIGLVILCISSCHCSVISTHLNDKDILRSRVESLYRFGQSGLTENVYDFFLFKDYIPRNNSAMASYFEGIDTFRIESIKIDNGIAEISMYEKYLNNEKKYYSYWAYTKKNWYVLELRSQMSQDKESLDQIRKILREGLPLELEDELQKQKLKWEQ